jgi:hypothetical protein
VLWRQSETLTPHLPQLMEAEIVQPGDLGLERCSRSDRMAD